MKAIIEIARRGEIFNATRRDIATGGSRNFHLSFESARMLFSELTPARFDLLDTLRGVGPCSVSALARAARRNYSNVHTDIERLLQLGLVERTGDNRVRVPFTAIEVRLPLPMSA
jgi:predicted transcriptional regulator